MCLPVQINSWLDIKKKSWTTTTTSSRLVKTTLLDIDFDNNIDKLIDNVIVNTSSTKKHDTEIKCTTHTVKERTISVVRFLHFNYLHKLIITRMLYFAVLCLDMFPFKNDQFDKFSPHYISVRTNLDINKKFRSTFGKYCEVHDDTYPPNTMIPFTHEYIVVGLIGKYNGTYKLFWNNNRRIIKLRKWTKHLMIHSFTNNIDKWGKKRRI